jgi:hypothetical protein
LTRNSLERFVASDTRRGEPVLVLTRLPHRIAYDAGVNDVSRYSCGIEAMLLESQLRESIARLRRAHGHKVFLWTTSTFPEELSMLHASGFVETRRLTDNSIEQYEGQYVELRDDVRRRT